MEYIFDIDGTIADGSQRLHFFLPKKHDITCDANLDKISPDWESFYKDCVNDKPIAPTIDILRTLREHGAKIIVVTGRPEKYMDETMEWLCKQLETNCISLFMRKNGDHRPDYIVKKEIYDECIKPYHHIDGVFEDRKQCVDMWRRLGLTCYQVADGNY